MNPFTQKTFDIPELKGISAKNIEEHLKLYAGYVKNINLIFEKLSELTKHPMLKIPKHRVLIMLMSSVNYIAELALSLTVCETMNIILNH